jgi:rhodanese-related sulfurtransferase
MEKKIRLSMIFFFLAACVFAQTTYDDLLKTVYKNTVPQVKSIELKEKISANKKLVLLDTRSPEEYEVSHLYGAKLIDYDNFSPQDILTIDKNAEIIVYCTVGARSEKIGEKLLEMGFSNVENLYGGIFQWVNEDGPIVNKKNQPTDSVHTYSWPWAYWLKKGVKVN